MPIITLESIKAEHAANGDPLPNVVPAGPDEFDAEYLSLDIAAAAMQLAQNGFPAQHNQPQFQAKAPWQAFAQRCAPPPACCARVRFAAASSLTTTRWCRQRQSVLR